MQPSDTATVQALRGDLALQISRFVQRCGMSQVAAAQMLGIPQPTLSKIVTARLSGLSVELLIRIAVRARLSLVLQTGSDPSEAGVFVAGTAAPERIQRSRLAEQSRQELIASAGNLTSEQRLDAQLQHSELMAQFQQGSKKLRSTPATTAARRSR